MEWFSTAYSNCHIRKYRCYGTYIFSTLSNVSIYAVYHLVTNGIKLIFTSVATSVKSLLGDMFVRGEFELLNNTFSKYEWAVHVATTLVYSIAAILIAPFVEVYTVGVNDANYIQPIFGMLLCLAMAIQAIRLPYSQMIMAVGHFKETQTSAIIEAIMNLSISTIVVFKYGLIGVAVGTIVAVLYRTIYFVWYLSKHILKRNILIFIKLIFIDVFSFISIYFSTKWITLNAITYLAWIIMAMKVGIISLVIVIIVSLTFSRKVVLSILKKKYS